AQGANRLRFTDRFERFTTKAPGFAGGYLLSDVGWLLANVATNENKTVFTDLDCIRELLPERAWK
ncbi:MAG: hypothetical protein N0C90_05470, partial [Candidatus Thiodiazotropha endolucinida]|nr:hypothetical protein [Candidatus Thiodiazotropha taylori]MCW4260796.1 hypothetical protein [Candidatus Thiodiazotropha endolucinida]